MRDLLMYGIDGWRIYYQYGTSSVYLLFAFLYLGTVYGWKRKNEEVTNVQMAVRITGVLFLALLCPFISKFVNRLNYMEDASFLYFLIPTPFVLAAVGVELYDLMEKGSYGRFKKPILLIGMTALFFTTLLSPFRLSVGHLSVVKGLDKISKDAYEIVEVIGEGSALVPKRYAAELGEISSDISFASMEQLDLDETDMDKIVSSGQDLYAKYVVVDKWKLSADALMHLNETFEANRYTLVSDRKDYAIFERGEYWVMAQHDDAVGQGTFYTFYNKDKDSLIVIDGGWDANAEHVREVINGYGGHVTAWILTHYHLDHAGAFLEIYKDPQGITIDDIYVSSYDSAYDVFLETYEEWDNPETFATYMEETNGGTDGGIHHPKRGDKINVDGLEIKFFNTYDEKLLELYEWDYPNNCGLVFSVRGEKDSALFMGDMYAPEIGEYMIDTYGEEIQTEYIQCCHHGNSIMPYSFYEAVNPNVMFFDMPEGLMKNADLKAKDLAAWADDNGITRYDFSTAPNIFKFW